MYAMYLIFGLLISGSEFRLCQEVQDESHDSPIPDSMAIVKTRLDHVLV